MQLTINTSDKQLLKEIDKRLSISISTIRKDKKWRKQENEKKETYIHPHLELDGDFVIEKINRKLFSNRTGDSCFSDDTDGYYAKHVTDYLMKLFDQYYEEKLSHYANRVRFRIHTEVTNKSWRTWSGIKMQDKLYTILNEEMEK